MKPRSSLSFLLLTAALLSSSCRGLPKEALREPAKAGSKTTVKVVPKAAVRTTPKEATKPSPKETPKAAATEMPKEAPKAVPSGTPSANELVLFDGKSLDDWEARDAGGSGNVELLDDQMIIGTGESLTGAVYKHKEKLPVTNYEITLEAQRLEGLDFFCGLTFPVGSLETSVTLVLGGWGGSVTGLSSLDGMDASENQTGHYRRFKDKTWYRVKVRVTPESVIVWCDDEKIIDTDIAGKKVGVRAGPIEDYVPLSLTTYQTTAAIRNVKVTALPPVAAKK